MRAESRAHARGYTLSSLRAFLEGIMWARAAAHAPRFWGIPPGLANYPFLAEYLVERFVERRASDKVLDQVFERGL